MLKNIWVWVKRHKLISIVILVVILLVLYLSLSREKTEKFETTTVQIGDVKEEVSVTGTVKPKTDVNLAFEKGGKISSLPVVVGNKVFEGQILATLSNADLLANLNQAKANLKKAQAVLGNSADKVDLEFVQSKTELTNEIKDSYTDADDAVRNKIYSLFNDPQRYNARLSFVTSTYLQEDIEEGRNEMSDMLDAWQKTLERWNGVDDLSLQYQNAKDNLVKIRTLLDSCAMAVNGLTTESGTVTETNIATWKQNISLARSSINDSINSLTSTWSDYDTASLNLQLSKGDTLAEQASIDQAEAEVASAEAELNKTIIRSPISGVVTDIPVKLGEIVPANQTIVSVITYGDYEIETFVPEADIAKIKISNSATVTLDAYGPEIKFLAKVIKIDPAATVVDGVPTYKVTLKFENQDERVRSGMTANLEVVTSEKIGVLIVPTRAITTKNDARYIKVLGIDGSITERIIEIGLRGYNGKTEVVSGLEIGETIISK